MSKVQRFPARFCQSDRLDKRGISMTKSNQAAFTAILISCGTMLGAGIGAAFESIAIGIPAGMALGGLAAIGVNIAAR
jgi:hypothetical protein